METLAEYNWIFQKHTLVMPEAWHWADSGEATVASEATPHFFMYASLLAGRVGTDKQAMPPATNTFQLPVRFPELFHMHLLWVAVCL